MKKPNVCICGSKLVPGEAEIEPITGVKMIVPALLCLNDDCELGFVVDKEVMARAEELAKQGIYKYVDQYQHVFMQ